MFGKYCYRIDESLLGVSCPVSWIRLYPNKQGDTHISLYSSEVHSPFPCNTLCTLSVPNHIELQEGRRKWSNPPCLFLSPLCLKDTLLVSRASQKILGVWVPVAACGCCALSPGLRLEGGPSSGPAWCSSPPSIPIYSYRTVWAQLIRHSHTQVQTRV